MGDKLAKLFIAKKESKAAEKENKEAKRSSSSNDLEEKREYYYKTNADESPKDSEKWVYVEDDKASTIEV